MEYLYRDSINKKLKTIKRIKKGTWIRANDPSIEEIDFLEKKFSLERDELLDGLDAYEVPRFEYENGNTYLFLRLPRRSVGGETSSFLLVLADGCFITITKNKLGMLEKFSAQNDFLTTDNMDAAVKILAYISRSFGRNVNRILKDVQKNRKRLSKLNTKDILELVKQEDLLNDYVGSFSSLIAVYERLIKSRSIGFDRDEREHIEDIVIDMNQTFNSCKSALKTISNMRDYYSTSLSHNLNKILSALTFFTIFLTVPATVSSFYGMNISLPFQSHPFAFTYIILLIVGIWVVLFSIFRKYRIL